MSAVGDGPRRERERGGEEGVSLPCTLVCRERVALPAKSRREG
jgi:hypothetical protein